MYEHGFKKLKRKIINQIPEELVSASYVGLLAMLVGCVELGYFCQPFQGVIPLGPFQFQRLWSRCFV